MKKPTTALHTLLSITLVGATLALAACSDRPPASGGSQGTFEALSGPSLGKMPIGATTEPDTEFTFVIDPSQSYSLALKTHRLDIPARAICDLNTSGYGATFWNSPCTPSSVPVAITAHVHGASGGLPQVDFTPALRFNPATEVMLYMYVKNPRKAASNWQILYCASKTAPCTVEDDRSFADQAAKTVFRRIKHFSGYMVSE